MRAITVSSRDLPSPNDLDRWLLSLVEQGVTTIICPLDTASESNSDVSESNDRRSGIYFRSEWAPMVRDVVGELIPSAHQRGLTVVVAFSPRRTEWMDPGLGWNDRVYDPARRQLRLSPYMDLFHPAFQEYLIGLLADLAATGIDGLLFQNDIPLGPYDGFSVVAVHAFEKEFQVRLDPSHLFQAVEHGAGLSDGRTGQYPPEFWRWIGWKAREQTKILERLGRAMRSRADNLQLAVEVHTEAVTDPRDALVRYSEDLLEAKRRFQYFLLRPTVRSHVGLAERQPIQALDQMKSLLGQGKTIWLAVPKGISNGIRFNTMLDVDGAEVREDVGLIYINN